jgi:hypothetical protein
MSKSSQGESTFSVDAFRLQFGSRNRRVARIGPLLEILDRHCFGSLGTMIRVDLELDGGDLHK